MCFLGRRVLEVTVIQEHVAIREKEKQSKLTVGAHKDSRCLLKSQRQGALVGIKRKSLNHISTFAFLHEGGYMSYI